MIKFCITIIVCLLVAVPRAYATPDTSIGMCAQSNITCPSGYTLRDPHDFHHCPSGSCTEMDCCYQSCADAFADGLDCNGDLELPHERWYYMGSVAATECCRNTEGKCQSWAGTCPAGSEKRHEHDMHQCTNGVCNEEECCGYRCNTFTGTCTKVGIAAAVCRMKI